MDSLQRAFYGLKFENAFLRRKGKAFEDLFARIMGHAFPADERAQSLTMPSAVLDLKFLSL